MTSRFLGYGRQFIEEDDLRAVREVLESDFLTQGPAIEKFERQLAERVNAKHAVAVSSGTAALHISCLAAGMTANDRGLTSAITFVASANCIRYTGASVGMVEISRDALGMDSNHLAQSLSIDPHSSVIIPVHMAGLACNMHKIREVAGNRAIIEDASHALGGRYEDGRPVGCCAYSDMTVFSFHPVKPVTTAEGGAVVTNDAELARRLRLYRNHGIERDPDYMESAGWDGSPPSWWYEQQVLGFNYRMNDIQAALGASQLNKLDRFIARRREIAQFYDAELSNIPYLERPQSGQDDRSRSALHLFIVSYNWLRAGRDRARFMRTLGENGIGTQIHYIPLYKHPYHRPEGLNPATELPEAERHFNRCVTLPLHQGLSDEDATRVVESVRAVLGA